MKLASSVDAAALNNTFLHQVKENEQRKMDKIKYRVNLRNDDKTSCCWCWIPINMNKNEQNQTSILLFSLCQDWWAFYLCLVLFLVTTWLIDWVWFLKYCFLYVLAAVCSGVKFGLWCKTVLDETPTSGSNAWGKKTNKVNLRQVVILYTLVRSRFISESVFLKD